MKKLLKVAPSASGQGHIGSSAERSSLRSTPITSKQAAETSSRTSNSKTRQQLEGQLAKLHQQLEHTASPKSLILKQGSNSKDPQVSNILRVPIRRPANANIIVPSSNKQSIIVSMRNEPVKSKPLQI